MKKAILLIGVVALFGCSEKQPELGEWESKFRDFCIEEIKGVGRLYKNVKFETIAAGTVRDNFYSCREKYKKPANPESWDEGAYENCITQTLEKIDGQSVEISPKHGPVTHYVDILVELSDSPEDIEKFEFSCQFNHPDGSATPDKIENVSVSNKAL